MKSNFWSMMLGGSLLFASCISDGINFPDVDLGDGEGKLLLSLTPSADFEANTRALNESNYRDQSNYTVELYKNGDETPFETFRMSQSGSTLPVTVKKGSYWARAYYGVEHDASRNEFFVEGKSQLVQVNPDGEATIPITCTPTCGKIIVSFDNEMATYYETFNVTFGGTQKLGTNTFVWAANDIEPWYVAVNEDGETINYSIYVKVKSQYVYVADNGNKMTEGTATGSFTLQRNRAQRVTIKPSYTPTEDGWLTIQITIDDTTNEKEKTFEVPVTWIK